MIRTFTVLVLLWLLFCPAMVLADADGSYRSQLEELLSLDQMFRKPGGNHKWSEVADQQAVIDRENVARLMALVELHGWPRMSEVGEDAALGAFLVLQHADLEVQERFLPVIRALVPKGEAKGAWLALLTDRIRVRHGLPQLYGTQSRHDPETGRSELLPIEDRGSVNDRRRQLGMKPLSVRDPARLERHVE